MEQHPLPRSRGTSTPDPSKVKQLQQVDDALTAGTRHRDLPDCCSMSIIDNYKKDRDVYN